MTTLPLLESRMAAGKRVLLRADLNVPMREGEITDRTRIERFLPTLQQLTDTGAKVILTTHLGRPKGKRTAEFSLAPLAKLLAEMTGQPVTLVDDFRTPEGRAALKNLTDGQVALLENLRFDPGEETNDPGLAEDLAALGDLYVNDAFSCAHRAHASTYGVAERLPAFAGPSLAAEVSALAAALDHPRRPVTAVIGGAKVSSKIDVLTYLLPKMDHMIIGGGMANTFLLAEGLELGKSLVERDALETARAIIASAEKHSCRLHLPEDFVVAPVFAAGQSGTVVAKDKVPADQMALDLGPLSLEKFTKVIEQSETVLWNGPMGAFEIEPFGKTTFALAKAAAAQTEAGKLLSVAGGGDTVAALNGAGVADHFSYVSTAGGAFLEWLEGKTLPGIAILLKP